MDYNKLIEKIDVNKSLEIIGHIFFLGFIVWCAVYFRERLLNNDAGFYTWHLTNHGEAFILHDRFINYISMGPAALAMKLGANLKTTLIIYSSTFGVIYYTYFLLSTYCWKNVKGGAVLMLSLILMMRTKHYAGHTEITMAIGQCALLWSWITAEMNQGSRKSRWYWPIIVAILGLMFITHPVIVVPVMMLLGYKLIRFNEWKSKSTWAIILLTIATFALKFLGNTNYESDKTDSLSSALDVFTNTDKYYVFHIVKNFFETQLHLPTLVFLIGIGILIKRKRVWSSLYMVFSALLLLGMVIVVHAYLRSDVYIMIDGYMGMLGLLFAVVIVEAYLDRKNAKLGLLVVLFLTIFSADRIVSRSSFFTERLDYYTTTMDLYPGHSKFLCPMSKHDWELLYYPYEISAESLILTCMEGKDKCRTLYMDYNKKGPKLYENSENDFLFFDNRVDYEKMNSDFFDLPYENYIPIDKVTWR